MVRIGHLLDKMPSQCSGGEFAAGRAGAHAGDQPVDLPARRAAVEPRRQAAPRAARRMRPAARGAQAHLHLRHPRPGGGDDARRPHRRDARRRDRAGRLADGDLLQSGELFRRRFLRLAVDEPGRRRDRLRGCGLAVSRRRIFPGAAGAISERAGAAPRPSASGPSTSRIRPDGGGDHPLPVRLVEPLGKDTLLYFDDGTRARLRRGQRRARDGRIEAGRAAWAVARRPTGSFSSRPTDGVSAG